MALADDFARYPAIASAYNMWVSARPTGGHGQYDVAVQLKAMHDECASRSLSWFDLSKGSLGHTRSGWELANKMIEAVGVAALNDRNLWGKVLWKGVAKLYECRREGFEMELQAVTNAIARFAHVTDREFATIFSEYAPQTRLATGAKAAGTSLNKIGYRKAFEAVLGEIRAHLTSHPEHAGDFPIASSIIGPIPMPTPTEAPCS